MRLIVICSASALALSACAPSVPDSGAGVGFGDYNEYQARTAARDAQLEGRTTVPPPADVSSSTLSGDPVIDGAEAALNGTGAPAAGPVPQTVENAAGISNENNFDTVSSERDIAADAALIARNRAQYEVIQPTALPTRSGSDGPNIVDYALRTTNARGTPLYRRSSFTSEAKAQRACAAYESDDLAQEAFLAAGGPERDRRGLDPDGDGFACTWDPTPFRAVRRN
ncbi:hypothetical protein ACOXXX_07300 [Thalassococcus sp. BH17M4-6]|uniref:hypothetical protein n=1 Tax=Thalassococcus sp. BH17M4-6 TaxID=3413148 RepID=UPI003BD71525